VSGHMGNRLADAATRGNDVRRRGSFHFHGTMDSTVGRSRARSVLGDALGEQPEQRAPEVPARRLSGPRAEERPLPFDGGRPSAARPTRKGPEANATDLR